VVQGTPKVIYDIPGNTEDLERVNLKRFVMNEMISCLQIFIGNGHATCIVRARNELPFEITEMMLGPFNFYSKKVIRSLAESAIPQRLPRLVSQVYCHQKMGGFVPLDGKDHGPLQIADMLANSVMHNHTKMIKSEKVASLKVDFITKSDLRVWKEDDVFAALAHELKRRGYGIPDDLLKHYGER